MEMVSTTTVDSLNKDLMPEIPMVIENERKELIIDIPLVMEPVQWQECCIYKVPDSLREKNSEAYTPKLISIGPFHQGKDKLREMEMLKVRYLKEFCYRTGKCQKEIVSMIEENEVMIRHCYAEISGLGSEDYVKMVVLDSIFIIEHFWRVASREREKYEDDYISSKPWLQSRLLRDLILLENQIPFFILEELHNKFSRLEDDSIENSFFGLACKYFSPYNMSKPAEQNDRLEDDSIENSFFELACKYFSPYYMSKSAEQNEKHFTDLIPAGQNVKHFTDLIRYFNRPSELNIKKSFSHLYTATKLNEAGVTFTMAPKERLLDIKFKKYFLLQICPFLNFSWLINCLPCLSYVPCLNLMRPLLKIRRFEVNDGTEGLFRNLMALEQCHYPSESYICNYIVLFDHLVDTEEDVELLVERGIIVNKLSSKKAVAKMLNTLGVEIEENNSCYADQARELNDHYGQCWNQNMGYLSSTYFSNVWKGAGTIIGLLILVMTLLDIYYTFAGNTIGFYL